MDSVALVRFQLFHICGYDLKAMIFGFQPDRVGSIPSTRSKTLDKI